MRYLLLLLKKAQSISICSWLVNENHIYLLLIKADTEGRRISHVDSMQTIVDVQGVYVAVEGGEDLPANDVVTHHQAGEEHQPSQERGDHAHCDTAPEGCCPRHKTKGDVKQSHPGPVSPIKDVSGSGE